MVPRRRPRAPSSPQRSPLPAAMARARCTSDRPGRRVQVLEGSDGGAVESSGYRPTSAPAAAIDDAARSPRQTAAAPEIEVRRLVEHGPAGGVGRRRVVAVAARRAGTSRRCRTGDDARGTVGRRGDDLVPTDAFPSDGEGDEVTHLPVLRVWSGSTDLSFSTTRVARRRTLGRLAAVRRRLDSMTGRGSAAGAGGRCAASRWRASRHQRTELIQCSSADGRRAARVPTIATTTARCRNG